MTAEEYVKHYASGQGGYESVPVDIALRAIEYAKRETKQQFENNRLKHCNNITNEQAELEQGFIDQHLDEHQRMPTFLDAIEYGMNLQKEQMIKNAVDGVVAASAGGDGWVNIATGFVKSEDVNVKFGDKIKIIIIKNDEL